MTFNLTSNTAAFRSHEVWQTHHLWAARRESLYGEANDALLSLRLNAGVLENASKPTLPSFDLTAGSSMILRSSLLSCVTIVGGVWAGATIPAHESMSN